MDWPERGQWWYGIKGILGKYTSDACSTLHCGPLQAFNVCEAVVYAGMQVDAFAESLLGELLSHVALLCWLEEPIFCPAVGDFKQGMVVCHPWPPMNVS